LNCNVLLWHCDVSHFQAAREAAKEEDDDVEEDEEEETDAPEEENEDIDAIIAEEFPVRNCLLKFVKFARNEFRYKINQAS
jgi:hypothetical protein